MGSVNNQSGGDINISDARYLTKLNKDVFCEYQDKFDINYWKLDGMLLNPSTEQSEYYVTGNPLYTISETYERWTDIFEDMRDNRAGKDLWLNMTSYTNPSPWHVQWVNSVWIRIREIQVIRIALMQRMKKRCLHTVTTLIITS